MSLKLLRTVPPRLETISASRVWSLRCGESWGSTRLAVEPEEFNSRQSCSRMPRCSRPAGRTHHRSRSPPPFPQASRPSPAASPYQRAPRSIPTTLRYQQQPRPTAQRVRAWVPRNRMQIRRRIRCHSRIRDESNLASSCRRTSRLGDYDAHQIAIETKELTRRTNIAYKPLNVQLLHLCAVRRMYPECLCACCKERSVSLGPK